MPAGRPTWLARASCEARSVGSNRQTCASYSAAGRVRRRSRPRRRRAAYGRFDVRVREDALPAWFHRRGALRCSPSLRPPELRTYVEIAERRGARARSCRTRTVPIVTRRDVRTCERARSTWTARDRATYAGRTIRTCVRASVPLRGRLRRREPAARTTRRLRRSAHVSPPTSPPVRPET